MIGQTNAQVQIDLLLSGAAARNTRMPSLLFTGPAGHGKTSLARAVATELNADLVQLLGANLIHPALIQRELLAAVDNGKEEPRRLVLFIDEIHRAAVGVLEVLYTVIEDGLLLLTSGTGASARAMTLSVPHAVVIGATTEPNRIPKPLEQRMETIRLVPYTTDEIAMIVAESTRLDPTISRSIALRSRRNPRIAKALGERALDYIAVHGYLDIDKLFEIAGVGGGGLTSQDVSVMRAMRDTYQLAPVGLSALASTLNLNATELSQSIEPWLVELGMISRTPRGRMLTQKGLDYLSSI